MAAPQDGTDGRFDLYVQNGWIHLSVLPPTGGGRRVYREEIQSRMKLLGMPRIGGSELSVIIEAADGQPHRLVEWPDGTKLESVTSIAVRADGLIATAHVTAPKRGALPPTVGDVVRALESAGVSHGVDRDAIARLIREGLFGQSIEVARGEAPVHAQPGEIRYHFNPDRGKPYLMMEYGRINLRELNFIENKAAGALLAELLPAVPAVDGRTVTGALLPADRSADTVELVAGENTEVTDGGSAIHATEDGNVRLIGDAVVIEPLISVEHVNYETGNIRFDGSVVVEKTIADGFVVEAGGDVQVGRGVGRAKIIAGGNVLLKSGINGGGEGCVECGGYFVAKYVEGSHVTCGLDVFVEEAIMHSELTAVRHCVLTGRRAEIIASDVVVGGSLWCRKLGSIAEAATGVTIGVPPEVVISHRKTLAELRLAEERLEKVEEQLRQVDRVETEGRDDERVLQARNQLQDEREELRPVVKEYRNTMRQLRDRLEASRKSMLVVEDTIFAGSVVCFGRTEYRPPTQGARATILTHRHGEVQESGFNPNERPKIDFGDELKPPHASEKK